jgi:hypothetical protein
MVTVSLKLKVAGTGLLPAVTAEKTVLSVVR